MKSQVEDFLTTTRESITYSDRHDVTCPARGGRGGHVSPTWTPRPARHPLRLPPPRRRHELAATGQRSLLPAIGSSLRRCFWASGLGDSGTRLWHPALAAGSVGSLQ